MALKVRHLRALVIPMDCVVDFILNWHKPGEITFPVFTSIPSDAKYVRSYYDNERDCLMVILEHPDFLETHVGNVVENAHYTIEMFDTRTWDGTDAFDENGIIKEEKELIKVVMGGREMLMRPKR